MIKNLNKVLSFIVILLMCLTFYSCSNSLDNKSEQDNLEIKEVENKEEL